MRENGSPPEFLFDDDHSYFATVLPVHPGAPTTASDVGDDLRGEERVSEQIAAVVAHLDGEMTRQILQAALGLGDREHFRKAYLAPALEAGLIEMTQPDKPNSRSQRYRLTAAGKQLRRQGRKMCLAAACLANAGTNSTLLTDKSTASASTIRPWVPLPRRCQTLGD